MTASTRSVVRAQVVFQVRTHHHAVAGVEHRAAHLSQVNILDEAVGGGDAFDQQLVPHRARELVRGIVHAAEQVGDDLGRGRR